MSSRFRCLFIVLRTKAGYHIRLMLKALLLVIDPTGTWGKVIEARRGVAGIILLQLLPILLITSFAEGYGMVHWGKMQHNFAYMRKFTVGEVVIFETAQLILSMAVVFIAAKIIKSLGETFHGRHTYSQAFTTVAYGLSPMFALRLADMSPSINPWLPWALGAGLCIMAFYQGVPRVMEPDPPHAFGLYITSSLLITMTTGLARLLTAWYLAGRLEALDTFVQNLAKHLPF